MESLGEKLRAARGKKGITLDQAGRETNISVRFLEALETENFSGFPGETYITGFIKNYAKYLDLDDQEMLSLYRAFKIQEQPVPLDELIKPRSKLPKILAVIAIAMVVLGACGLAGYFFFTARSNNPIVRETSPPIEAVEHTMSSSFMERRLFMGDVVTIPTENGYYRVELVNLGETITIRTPDGPVILDLSQEVNLDLEDGSFTYLQITAVDFVRNNPVMGVLLHFNKRSSIAAEELSHTAILTTETVAIARFASPIIVLSSPNPFPFTLQVSFQGFCMFRWEILFERDRRERNERYFQQTDELTIQAQNGIRMWSSSAQAARFQVIGGGRTVPLEIGGPGEVVVADLRWIRTEDNRFSLALMRLETGS